MEETRLYPWRMSCGCTQLVTEWARPGVRTRCETHGRVRLTGPDGPSRRRPAKRKSRLARLRRTVKRWRR